MADPLGREKPQPEYINDLLVALEARDLGEVQTVMSRMTTAERQLATLAARSTSTDRALRTPLMAAAETGVIAILSVVLDAFNILSSRLDITRGTSVKRHMTLAGQLEITDMYGMTLLMHAAASGNAALFDVVIQQVEHAQLRKIIRQTDAGGMTFLMHVACCGEGTGLLPARALKSNVNQVEDNHGPTNLTREPNMDSTTSGAEAKSEYEGNGHEGDVEAVVSLEAHEPPDPWVPVVRAAFDFAKAGLWLPEYRNLMTARDCWNRSVIEHSILSGSRQVFEAVFDALRKNVHDETIDIVLETGEGVEVTTMRTALESAKGLAIEDVVALKARQLKILQLLLPELDDTSDNPLYLLIALCLVAPFWAWGSTLVGRKDPELQYTRATRTLARYFLSIPAMFFWGVGTSSIAISSFQGGETAAAAALAVASIVIPAIDSFFSGRGAQIVWATIFIWAVDFWDGIANKNGCCNRSRVSRSSLRKKNAGTKGTSCALMLCCVEKSRSRGNGNGGSSPGQSTRQNASQDTRQNASQNASQDASRTASQNAWHSASQWGDRDEGGASSSDAPSSIDGGGVGLQPRILSARY